MKYLFYVVEFLDPPYSEFDPYVCIPGSWIKLREVNLQTVVVRYPIEKHSQTKKRVKRGDAYSEQWGSFEAYVVFGSDSYEDAKKYTKKMNIAIEKTDYSSETEEDDNCSATPKTVLRLCNQSNLLKRKGAVNKPLPENPVLASGDDIHINQHPVKTANSADEQTPGTSTTDRQEPAPEKRLIVKIERLPDNKKPNQVDYIAKIDDSTEQSSVSNETTESTNISMDPATVNKPSFVPYIMSLMKELLISYENSRNIMRKFLDAVRDNRDNTNDSAEITATAKAEKENGEKQTEVIKPKDEAVVLISDDENEEVLKRKATEETDEDVTPVKRMKGPRRSFVLPPDYDPNDTKWTLRYHEPAQGLVELIQHSGIYVNDLKLRECKRVARDSKTLARLLLVEIFSKSALGTCSLTGAGTRPFYANGRSRRPGLDERGRMVLLNYVMEYAAENDWVQVDSLSICIALRNKLNSLRPR